MTRPFFSIIIPCYNDGRYQEGNYLDCLLDNLCYQKLSKDELEVIIVDDQSPVSYECILDKYAERLTIYYFKTSRNLGPGHARQVGTTRANGEWITFIDHDDLLYPNALLTIKDFIQLKNPQYLVVSEFNKVSEDGEVLEEFKEDKTDYFVHGRFYNRENFWYAFNLQFPENLRTHEDIAIGTQCKCILDYLKEKPLYIPVPTYIWIDDKTSVSNTDYRNIIEENGETSNFLERSFPDFIESKWSQYIEMYKRGYLSRAKLFYLSIREMISCWIILNSCKVAGRYKYENQNVLACKNAILNMLSATNTSPAVLKVYISKLVPKDKGIIDRTAEKYGVLNLFDWIDYIVNYSEEDLT